ncbi:hypothetical protein NKF06_11565 [Haloferax sp. AB510]|uniref:hypothetical protein n=1 Tax=Haloferax sp. AB510 TaxID=2934172 RepID=UPI00209BE577|nr:hypothetical protein [Haloferax sp. AB510]MCO8267208.1 hypothetical protein [Haloferax sp. AB510]
MSDNLQPLSPEEGVEMYLDLREGDVSETTLMNHGYRLNPFLGFCEEVDRRMTETQPQTHTALVESILSTIGPADFNEWRSSRPAFVNRLFKQLNKCCCASLHCLLLVMRFDNESF